MFLGNVPKLLNQLARAVEAKDHNSLKIVSHSLKPQLTYMGIKEDSSKIALLEFSADEKADFGKISLMVDNLNAVCAQAFEEVKGAF